MPDYKQQLSDNEIKGLLRRSGIESLQRRAAYLPEVDSTPLPKPLHFSAPYQDLRIISNPNHISTGYWKMVRWLNDWVGEQNLVAHQVRRFWDYYLLRHFNRLDELDPQIDYSIDLRMKRRMMLDYHSRKQWVMDFIDERWNLFRYNIAVNGKHDINRIQEKNGL